MNWITKALSFGEKIKKVLKKRPSKEDIENSDWTNCCKGPILKKELEENLSVCKLCDKHHRITPIQRFDILFGKNSYEILDTPIPAEDPLNWSDTKSYKDRLRSAQKKTKQNCATLIAKGNLNGIEVTAGAINFNFIGGSVGAAEGGPYFMEHNTQLITKLLMYFFHVAEVKECLKVQLHLQT